MRKTLISATCIALTLSAAVTPAEARRRGFGFGLGFGSGIATAIIISEAYRHHRYSYYRPYRSYYYYGASDYYDYPEYYDDSYAYLSGFGPEQSAEAVIQRNAGNPQTTHEALLLLRHAIGKLGWPSSGRALSLRLDGDRLEMWVLEWFYRTGMKSGYRVVI